MYDLNTLLRAGLIGLVAGFLAGVIVKGRGFGVAGDVIVGIFGAVTGAWLFSMVGLSAYGLVGTTLMSLAGALVFLALVTVVVRRA